jgi:glutamine phosphoribosylpyrophosphate amidotransferase
LAVALQGLKHRGADSVGALMYLNGVLDNVVRNILGSTIGFGHTRYITSGTHNPHNSQPFKVGDNDLQLELLFNGNIP